MTEPRWRRYLRFWHRNVGADVDDEVAFHVRMRVEQFIATGLSRDEAEVAARERFGDVTEVRAELVAIDERRHRTLDWHDAFDGVRQDLVVALRAVRRAPTFAVGVMLTVGLGIGANAAMFGVVDRLLLSGPAHVRDARRVQRLYITQVGGSSGPQTDAITAYPAYTALRDHSHFLAGVGTYGNVGQVRLGRGASADTVQMGKASWDLFPTLGVRPALGRFFSADEDHAPRGEHVAVFSYAFWNSTFAGDSSIVGKHIALSDKDYVVVGVAPRGFGGVGMRDVGVWAPITTDPPNRSWATSYSTGWVRIVARLAPGVTGEQASAEATAVLRASYTEGRPAMQQLVAAFHPLWYTDNGAPSSAGDISAWLMGVSVIVLLIICANAANLLLARTLRRRQEIAIRVALGVGSGRLLRLIMVETFVLVLGGAVFGVLVAAVGGRLMRATLLADISVAQSVINGRVLLFTAGAAMVFSVLVAILPVRHARRVSVIDALKSGEREGGGRRGVLRNSLFVAQVALSVVLLTAAGLFVESLNHLRAVDLGFQPERLLQVRTSFASPGLNRDSANVLRAQSLAAILERIHSIPSIDHAAMAIGSPYGNEFRVSLEAPGVDPPLWTAGEDPYVFQVSNDYFATVGTPLRRGRLFNADDRLGSEPVAIVDETMAKAVWPGKVALGQCIRRGPTAPCMTVVGVVADVHRHGIRETAAMEYYVPLGQLYSPSGASLLVRPRSDPAAAVAALRRLAAATPGLAIVDVTPIITYVDAEVRPWRLGAIMFGVFGLLALVVAAVGLYSVIAYLVADRTRELGVRIALGATSSRIVWQILDDGLRMTAVGIVVGVAAVFATGRFIEPMLFDVSSRGPGLLVFVSGVLIAVAIVAAFVPSWRATRIDPIRALRAD